MASTIIDRLDGLSSSAAIKGPCKVATTANISLYGQQTVDGVAIVAGDRVLVKSQTAGYENGIYVADTGQWRRSKDFNKTRDVVKGTLVHVTDGATQAGFIYEISNDNPVVIGTTTVLFFPALALGGANLRVDFKTEAEFVASTIPAVVTYVDTAGYYSAGDGGRHRKIRISTPSPVKAWHKQSADGAWWQIVADEIRPQMFGGRGNNAADDYTSMQATVDYSGAFGVWAYWSKGTWLHSLDIRFPDNSKLRGDGMDITIAKLTSADRNLNSLTNKNNTGSYLTNLAYNENIIIQDLTADNNGRRTGTGTEGCGVQFSSVRHFILKNVKGLNGARHGIDIAAAQTLYGYAEAGATNEQYCRRMSYDGLIENCQGVDPVGDDGISTHYCHDITIINPVCLMTGVQLPDASQNGLEIDEGSQRITVTGGYARGFMKGLQIKGHADTPAAQDVTVTGFTGEGNTYNFNVEHSTLRSTTGRNVTLIGCVSIKPVFTNPAVPDFTTLRSLHATAYDGLRVINFVMVGDPTQTTDANNGNLQLTNNLRNSVVDGLYMKDVNRPTEGCIRVPGSVGENVKVMNVHAVDCYGSLGWITAGSIGIEITNVYAETANVSSPRDALFRCNDATINSAATRIGNLTANAGYRYGVIDEETLGAGFMMPLGPNRFLQNAQTYWRRAISDADAATGSQPAMSIGYIEGNQNLGIGEGVSFDFRVMRPDGTEYTAGSIASMKASGTDGNQAHHIVISTKDDAGGSTRRIIIPAAGIVNAATDAAAAALNVPVTGIYRNGSVLMFRVS